MYIDGNWIEITVAFIASMVVAMVWYSDFGFNQPWTRQTGVSGEKLKKAQGRKPFIKLLCANLITTIVLADTITIASDYFDNYSVWFALGVSTIVWFGISATTLFQHNTFEMKSDKLTAINIGYQLAFFLVVALVVGLL